ncbi:DeoR/GlpR family DNA-binding transcription regulator [Streptomyces europaeiscabiei]|uniref:DeoR/GlpR family DNA-binding transcription regulator n=1 Tax=Streptomyces europaeiscabiei TaxID=146819 RepID=A0ABU4NTU0_9ACTN|nr:DeoR/GlpR family DNA-binding transcription regulator [Streptomyces europaeiscabiei]MDX2530387.1 DeoR/GlpR family DNA-binding transcription regulator [Streptomyces europaeiscabiei]MDX2765352.1 DeoR/GlpR family DNA-binding transcription regulator [Streptomyces europaeiscabiei]MDX3549010.1 DeoR/GlpR family DNA-binding transcription regulator [Streptomyces europaeiscabiei]MDX3555385.1 DeoR/GlpR family DNA-binding transcription regulator [Streptomyces europaeiscabiei]MDX3668388.1 DeoR/GlpR famil
MLAERRHQLILRALRSGGTASVADLAEQLDASGATIRRDLLKLEADGLLTRVHGGAVIDEERAPFNEAAEMLVAEKDAIAARAATMIEDGQSIILDSGTTVHRLALQLHGRRLTVITNNLAVYDELIDDENIDLMLLGGMVIRESRMLDGFMTEDNLRQVHVDWLFMGACGLRPGGQIMDTTVAEVPARRAMIAAGDRVVLLADRSKFPGTGMVKICGPEDLDALITNASEDDATCMALREAGVRVILTGETTDGG